jgi:outer membrane immunogenic protein
MSVRRFVLALGVLGVGPVAAMAADLPLKAPPIAPPVLYSWNGFYAGVNAGGIVGMNSDTQDAAFASTAFGANDLLNTSDKHAPAGALFGGQIGYNLQLSPRWLVGLEADWQWSSLKGSSTACTPAANVTLFGAGANGFGYCLTDEHKLTNIGTARVRGGMIVGDTLWYATGGAAWGTVKDNVGFVGSANPVIFPVALQPGPFLPTAASFSQTRLGWTVGVGAETKLSSNWSVKLEYLYVDLGSVTEAFPIAINPAFGPAFTTGGAAVATRTSHLTDNIVRIGLNYKLF